MLLLMMELRGRFNQKMIKKAKFGDAYFDEMGGFDSIEKDRVTGAVSEFSCVHDIVFCGLLMGLPGCRAQNAHFQANSRFTHETHAALICADEG